ncbi:Acyl-CoA synthetase member 2 mitochondrial [Sparganum proliferum]
MGSTISSLLDELVIQRIEHEVSQTLYPKMWLRYVDDTFVVIKNREVERLHQSLIDVFPAIQFTREEAVGDSLSFLDVKIQSLDDGNLTTSVHRKGFDSEIILNYGSDHPAAHKRSCVRTLLHRAYRYCSNDDLLKKELGYLYRLFRSNGYPISFVKNCFRRQAQPRGPSSEEEIVTQKFFSLPYMQGTSEMITHPLNQFAIRVSHKPASPLRTVLTRVKDSIPKEEQTNVIYRIPCANCPCVYVGHTGRRLGTRINEHKLAIRRRDPLSLIFAHALQCDHRFNWDNTEVIATANKKRTREFPEAWHTNADSINRHVDLDANYEGLRSRLIKPSPTPHQRPLIQAPAVLPTYHSPCPPTQGTVTVLSPLLPTLPAQNPA